ncbi:LCP family protein [Pseudofrankia inefficax]|uniref:Cell envelope-related transcriptional attenuator n=1 Tax=Pseudofrankia inefficax (strain DSM 45817 / CECT 9037 / DDB 130130 / EuI1c) TaxID=298654 RepID=E3IWI0_PSEI1|nr:LCP family protein [Pseudofrankia inefficax]ADP80163.1 cell envelope-related transcriptional attenuator [Pseudofrankia inefficax]
MTTSQDGKTGEAAQPGDGWPPPGARTVMRRTARAVLAAFCAVAVALTVAVVGFPTQSRQLVLSALLRHTAIDFGSAPPHGRSPTYVLFVASDRRDTLGSGAAEHVGTLDGQRADSIAILRLLPGGPSALLQIPRDLRAPVPGHGVQKLGAAYSFGTESLLAAVRSVTGIDVDHVVQVDFVVLVAVVDLLGGVDLSFGRPARDLVTGFHANAGTQHLSGAQALAFARSRLYEQYDGTRWVGTNDGDVERINRQAELVRTIFRQIGRIKDPLALLRVLWAVRNHLVVDQDLAGTELARIVTTVAKAHGIKTVQLPSQRAQTDLERLSPFEPLHWGSVSYQVLTQPAATTMLQSFVRGDAS